jgi:hypothetical protein
MIEIYRANGRKGSTECELNPYIHRKSIHVNKKSGQALEAQACNSSYSGSRHQEDQGSKPGK